MWYHECELSQDCEIKECEFVQVCREQVRRKLLNSGVGILFWYVVLEQYRGISALTIYYFESLRYVLAVTATS